MTVLVTGATGFLGSHVVERLARAGQAVRALARRTSDRSFLQTLEGVEIVEGSVDDSESVTRALRGVTGVVHAAGLVKARSADEFRRVNTEGTRNMLEAAKRAGSRLERFVYVSSLTAAGPSDADGNPVPLDREANPVTHYGRSKLAAECAVLEQRDAMKVVVLRPPAIYGPRDREILIFFRAIAKGVLPLTNPPRSKLSMLYGPDCAGACVRALGADVESGSLFYLDDGEVHTFADLIYQSEAALRKRAWLRFALPQPVTLTAAFLSELYGKLTNRAVMLTRDKCNELFAQWVCDGSLARQRLGWHPEVSFAEGVQRTVDWYREHRWI
ncbi:MAG TPA: NAD-dependent epimerase/dehydratase family protein [Polyangiaceae bacterium]|jgi:nucleoside-diphosphate-sugar epimerase